MATTWILAADASRAKILEARPGDPEFRPVTGWANPEGRARDRELQTDAQGRKAQFGGGVQGGDVGRSVGVDHDVETFSKNIARYLEHARNEHRFDRLFLVAPPRFLGRVRRNLTPQTRELVVDSMDEDLSWLDRRQLASHIRRDLAQRGEHLPR